MTKQAQRKYYTLISKSNEAYDNSDWAIEFGSYEKSDVTYEMQEYKERNKINQERIQYKIITTGDTQPEINTAVQQLNAWFGP